jgi:hypothetical protein
MKTRSILSLLSVTLLVGSLTLGGCKKRKEFKNEDGQASADSRTVQGENDAAISDINTAIGDNSSPLYKGATTQKVSEVLGNPQGCTVDTTGVAATGSIKLVYNGTVFNNRKREGVIKVTLVDYKTGMKWKTKGAVLIVEFMGYKVTRASDGKSVELNGIQNVTNETGGTWWELLFSAQPSLAHTVTSTSGGLNVKFDDGKTANYNINRRFTYTFSNMIITCVGEGLGSSNGLNNLENFGTTREGDAFTSQVTTPVIWNTTCGGHAPIQGAVNVKVDGKSFDLRVTFGVDVNGNSITVAPNNCAYGIKVEWTYKKKTNKKIYGYV